MASSTIIDRIRTLLESAAPFDQLPKAEREDILTDVSIRYFEAGEVIIEQGSTSHPGLYIVESGLVRLMDVIQQRLLDKVGEGDVFGSFGLVKGGASIYEAKAIEPTVCALLKGESFQQLYSQYDDFALYFQQDHKLYVRRMGSEMDVTGGHLLFSRSLNQFVHREMVSCDPETTARQVAVLMRREGVDAVVVLQQQRLAGIVTDSDLRNRLIARGGTTATPVRKLMSSPVFTVPTDATIHDALMTMLKHRVHRLVLTRREEAEEVPVAVLTDRDIAHFRGQDPVATVRRIDSAPLVAELVSIREQTNEQLLNLWKQGAQPEMLNRIMMVFYDRLAVRVLELVEREARQQAPASRVDLPWVWMRVGSGGREEMALNSQQHNALVYADPSSPEEAERAEKWFNLIAELANEALEACGFESSEYVARDARWRRPMSDWRKTFRQWIMQAEEGSITTAPLFFDLRGVYGDLSLVDSLKEVMVDALNVAAMDQERRFLRIMAAAALEHSPPPTLLRKLLRIGDNRTFDIRESGVIPIVAVARVLALECRYVESTNTFDRLRAASEAIPELSRPIDETLGAYQYLVDLRLESQLRAVEAGDPAVNQVEAESLNKMQQRLLKSAFGKASNLLDALRRRHDIPRRLL